LEILFKPKSYVVLKQGYSWRLFQKDIYAGFIVGIISLPMVIAFALASGVSPEKGIITAVIGGMIISILGGSRFQIGGPTAALIVVVYGVIQRHGIEGLMISTLIAGILLVIFGLLRLGSVIKLIPHPLIVGYTSGIAVLIFTYVLKDAIDVPVQILPTSFSQKWLLYFSNFNQVNFISLLVTVSTIIISLVSSNLLRKIPGYFVAVVLISIVVAIFKFPVSTIQSYFGQLTYSLDFKLPDFDIYRLEELIPPALTIAILCSIQSLLSAVVADGMTSSNHRSNTELIAQGVANILTPCLGGLPVSGAVVRTVTNIKNGAATPFSGLTHSLVMLLFLVTSLKWAGYIPISCLAGLLIVFAYNMGNWRSFFSILKGSKYDILVLLTSFFLTVFVNLATAIEVGMVFAALLFMQRISKMSNIESVDIDTDIFENYSSLPKGVDVYEISGPFFFGAAQSYKEALMEIGGKGKVLILRMRYVPFIDSTGLIIFREVIRYFTVKKVRIILSGVRTEVREELENCGLAEIIGREYICENFSEAVRTATEELNKKMYRGFIENS
jgi:SulP family sulfate permease